MIINFKERFPVTQGIHVEAPIAQAADIAAFIGSESFVVDIAANTATFASRYGSGSVVVRMGQVVSVTGEEVSVTDSAEFYERYEPQ